MAGHTASMSATTAHDARLALYLVEPSAIITDALATLLEDKVRTLDCFPSAESLLNGCVTLEPRRCLITELHLPGMSGIELMLALEREQLYTPTIIMTIEANVRTAVLAIRYGAVDLVQKPCIAAELFDGLNRIEETLSSMYWDEST